MKCRNHSTDISSAVGVCATCLRERLCATIAAEKQKQHAQQDRRESETATCQVRAHHRRFNSSPQIGFTGSTVTAEIKNNSRNFNGGGFRFRFSSLFPSIFGSKSGLDSGPGSDPSCDREDGHCHGESRGFSSESSMGWTQTPRRTPAAMRRGRNLSFCLFPPEMAVAGKSIIPAKPRLSMNRSRKLSDFGSYN